MPVIMATYRAAVFALLLHDTASFVDAVQITIRREVCSSYSSMLAPYSTYLPSYSSMVTATSSPSQNQSRSTDTTSYTATASSTSVACGRDYIDGSGGTYEVRCNTGLSGTTIRPASGYGTSGSASIGDCLDLCDQTQKCQAITYLGTNCMLYSAVTGQLNIVGGYVAYSRARFDGYVAPSNGSVTQSVSSGAVPTVMKSAETDSASYVLPGSVITGVITGGSSSSTAAAGSSQGVVTTASGVPLYSASFSSTGSLMDSTGPSVATTASSSLSDTGSTPAPSSILGPYSSSASSASTTASVPSTSVAMNGPSLYSPTTDSAASSILGSYRTPSIGSSSDLSTRAVSSSSIRSLASVTSILPSNTIPKTSSSSTSTSTSMAATASSPGSSTTASSTTTNAVASATPVRSYGKRGLAYTNDSYTLPYSLSGQNSQVNWGYNYYSRKYTGSDTSTYNPAIQFIPLLYSDADSLTSVWSQNVETAISEGADAILSFNEPDGCYPGSACMTVNQSVAGYKSFMQPFAGRVRLGAPAITNGGPPSSLTYLAEFLGNCTGCTIDFICLHWYSNVYAFSYLQYYVELAYNQTGLPIWLTEFGIDSSGGTDAQYQAFLEQALPWLDAVPYVERYAYFYDGPGYLISEDGTALSAQGVIYNSYTANCTDWNNSQGHC